MRDYIKAIEAIQEAEEHDTEHKHRGEIQQQELKCQQALFSQRTSETQEETLQRAMRDPEVAVRIQTAFRGNETHLHLKPGHHERSCDPANSATGSRKPPSVARPHEESSRASKDHETDQRRHHQDKVTELSDLKEGSLEGHHNHCNHIVNLS
jgi:hypothetical protein